MNIDDDELQQLILSINKRSLFKTKWDLEFINQKLSEIPFFRNMHKQIGDTQYQKILKELQYECHQPFEPQVKIGDQSTKFYFILCGKFLMLTRNFVVNLQLPQEIEQILEKNYSNLYPQGYLYPGQYFGEQIMMFDQSHTQTVLPLEKSHLIVIKRDIYRNIIDQENRKQETEKFALLSSVPLLIKWSSKTIRALLQDIQELQFIQNQIIYQQGDPVDAVFVIAEGEVQLFRQYNKTQVAISVLGCKESFGDDEILSQFRSHSAKTLSYVKVYRILKNKFLDHIPFDFSSKYFKNQTQQKLSLYQNEDQFRLYRSESLKYVNSPAKIMQKVLKRNLDKSKTHQSVQSFHPYNSLQDIVKRKLKHTHNNSSSPQLESTVPTPEHTRIHVNGKFDKTQYLLGQIKLRSTSLWKKNNTLFQYNK